MKNSTRIYVLSLTVLVCYCHFICKNAEQWSTSSSGASSSSSSCPSLVHASTPGVALWAWLGFSFLHRYEPTGTAASSDAAAAAGASKPTNAELIDAFGANVEADPLLDKTGPSPYSDLLQAEKGTLSPTSQASHAANKCVNSTISSLASPVLPEDASQDQEDPPTIWLCAGCRFWQPLFWILLTLFFIQCLLHPLGSMLSDMLKSVTCKSVHWIGEMLLPARLYRVLHVWAVGYPLQWQKQIVVITGGAHGLGQALAKSLIQLSATVIILDVKPVDSFLLEASSPGRLFTFPCNVADRHQVYQIAEFILGEIGVPTIVVNNAGVHHEAFLLELEDEEIEKTLSVNVLASFWVIKAFLPSMISASIQSKQSRVMPSAAVASKSLPATVPSTENDFVGETYRGHFVTIGSCLGLGAVAKLTDYCASKFAIYGFHESLRQEIRLLGLSEYLHTTIACPFLFKDGMFSGKVKIRYPWLTPPLQMKEVVAELVSAMERRDKLELWMPGFVQAQPLLRLLPTSWMDKIHRWFGSNEALLQADEVPNLLKKYSDPVWAKPPKQPVHYFHSEAPEKSIL